jgi:hypothetical protein
MRNVSPISQYIPRRLRIYDSLVFTVCLLLLRARSKGLNIFVIYFFVYLKIEVAFKVIKYDSKKF